MVELLEQIGLVLEKIVHAAGYPGIFFVMFLENIFTPIPTEPFMPLGGVLASHGQMNVFLVWGAGVTGAVVGSLVLYAFGRIGGELVVRRVIGQYGKYIGFDESALERATKLFNHYGAKAVFFGRFIPVVRPTVSLVSGISNLPLAIFIPFTALSSGLVTAFWVGVGYFIGENWQEVFGTLRQYQGVLIALIVVASGAAAGFFIYRRWLTKLPSKKAPVTELE